MDAELSNDLGDGDTRLCLAQGRGNLLGVGDFADFSRVPLVPFLGLGSPAGKFDSGSQRRSMLFILGPIVLVVFILGLFIANRNEKRWTHMGLLVAASLLIIIGVIYFAIGHGGTHH